MPNHITNWVRIKGTKEQIDTLVKNTKLIRQTGTDENNFDFNGIIPMPANSDTFFAEGGLGSPEKEKFGNNNWYDWSVKNWGTKWNCYSISYLGGNDTEIAIQFDTAWAAPEPIYDKLEEDGYTVDSIWQDEDPSNSGVYGEEAYDAFEVERSINAYYLGPEDAK